MSTAFDSNYTTEPSWSLSSPDAVGTEIHLSNELRLPRGSIADDLFRTPWKFDFFQTVSLLQDLSEESTGADNPAGPIGQFSLPSEECVRFTVPHTTAFPTASVPQIRWNTKENRALVEVNFMGLTGPSGVLPDPYNDRLRDIARSTKHSERGALRDWLDNFNHRLISLFYRAWTKYRFPVQSRLCDSQIRESKQEPARIRVALAAVAGLDRSLIAPVPVGDRGPKIDRDEWLGLAGLLAQRPMNATNLAAAIEGCLGVPVTIAQFQSCWLELDEESQSQLGNNNYQLGTSAILGDRIRTRQQRILIALGPLSAEDFRRFLPPSKTNAADGYLRLCELVEICCGTALQFDICPILQIQEPMEVQLSALHEGNRLGIDSWLGAPRGSDVTMDAVFAGSREPAA